MFSCLQINCQPFYLRQLLKFHQFDWLIEIYLQTEGQRTHHKMVSVQPMSGFSPLFLLPEKPHIGRPQGEEKGGNKVPFQNTCFAAVINTAHARSPGNIKQSKNSIFSESRAIKVAGVDSRATNRK